MKASELKAELEKSLEESLRGLKRCPREDRSFQYWQGSRNAYQRALKLLDELCGEPQPQSYATRQSEWVAEHGIEVGSRVRVNKNGEVGPNWNPSYARIHHGREGAVSHVCERWGVIVAFSDNECVWFPFTVLEPVVDIEHAKQLTEQTPTGDYEPAASSPQCIRADDGTYVWSPGTSERTYTADELRVHAAGLDDMNREPAATQEQAVQVREPSYEWLLAYYESNEEFASKLGSAMDIFENHFDEQGKLLGNGKWRLDELGKALVMVREATQGFVNRMAPIATVPPPEQPGEAKLPKNPVNSGTGKIQGMAKAVTERIVKNPEILDDIRKRLDEPIVDDTAPLMIEPDKAAGPTKVDLEYAFDETGDMPVRRRVEPQPEPTYRAFRSAEEFKPHRDRWIRNPGTGTVRRVEHYSDTHCNGMPYSMLVRGRVWDDDGQPCGVAESEGK